MSAQPLLVSLQGSFGDQRGESRKRWSVQIDLEKFRGSERSSGPFSRLHVERVPDVVGVVTATSARRWCHSRLLGLGFS